MTPLEKRKKEVELAHVRAARMSLELKIDEMLAEIERLKSHVEISLKKESDIEKELR